MEPPAPYRAPWWLPGGHLQTIYPALLWKGRSPPYRRERWNTPDGDFVDADWLDGNAHAPLVVLFHGLEGCSRSHYAASLMQHLRTLGWRGVVPHFRGCSGEPNRLARAYHSGDADEIGWMLGEAAARSPGVPIYAAGVSLGGNALLKWLARTGVAAGSVIRKAAAVSAPVALQVAGDGLADGFNRVYTWHFLRPLKRKSIAKLALFPGLYDAAAVTRAANLRQFDDVVTAPLHGFRDADDYWTRASSKPDLGRIAIPTLIVHADNDPFFPGAYLPDPAQVPGCVRLEVTRGGGHAGFPCGRWPGRIDWLPRRLTGFFESRAPAAADAA